MTKRYETLPVHLSENQRPADADYFRQLNDYFGRSAGTDLDKLRAFTRFVPLAEIGRFLARYEIFKRVLGVQGSVVECGVFNGAGLMTWAALSAIHEPLNHTRKVIGFDSFRGFTAVTGRDAAENPEAVVGGLAVDSKAEIEEAIRLFDLYRPLGHIPKVELVAGDALETIPTYLKQNPHLVVALLYLDFDLYEPTRCALDALRPRMPRGSIIAFDQMNLRQWPGETQAVADALGIATLRIERFPFQPQISFAVLE